MFLLCGISLDAQSRPSAVRVLPEVLAATLQEGTRFSSTLRALVDELEQSDLIVYVLGAPAHHRRRVAGTMQFVLAAGGRRYLRITVDERIPKDARIATLAHELQHAVEVARAPSVTDLRSFGQLYRQIGTRLCICVTQACYDTPEAKRTGERVLADLRDAAASR